MAVLDTSSCTAGCPAPSALVLSCWYYGSVNTPPPGGGEETRLLTSLTDCGDRVNAARHAILYPNHSMLMTEYTILVNDLKMARNERAKAIVMLREYRKSKPAQLVQRVTS